MSELKTEFFLGANSRSGFASLYGGFIGSERPRRVWVLKGCPGCGKSSLMRQVAGRMEEAGLAVETILCSGDPDSLDGIRVPAAGAVIVDGTAPHVLEPPRPGAGGFYVNLGECCDAAGLRDAGPELEELTAVSRREYERAYRFLAAAGEMDDEARIAGEEAAEAVRRRAEGVAAREFGKRAARPGRARLRYLDAISCQGRLTLWDTVRSLCARVWTLDRDLGLASPMVETLRDRALEAGLDVIFCPDPLSPGRAAHLLVPGLSLAFVSSGRQRPYPEKPERHLRLDAHAGPETGRAARQQARKARASADALTDDAVERLAEAKRAHDELERLYHPHVDFSAVYARAEDLAEEILREV